MDRKSKTRLRNTEDILQAAQQLFAERGVAAVSMDDIALASGFSKGSLYNYFENRDELIWSVVQNLHTNFLDRAESILAGIQPFRERFRQFLETAFEMLEKTVGLSEILDFLMTTMDCCNLNQGEGNKPALEFSQSFHTRLQPYFTAAYRKKELAVADGVRFSLTLVMAIHHLHKAGQLGLISQERKDNYKFLMELLLPKSNCNE